MAVWISDGFRPCEAADATEAATIFGGRLARRRYGKSGSCTRARLDTWREDRTAAHFELSIGRPVHGGGFQVWSAWITVRRA